MRGRLIPFASVFADPGRTYPAAFLDQGAGERVQFIGNSANRQGISAHHRHGNSGAALQLLVGQRRELQLPAAATMLMGRTA
jgi:hypothetical protein